MADTKITALTAISTNPVNPATFPIPMVDLLDTSMAASGTTKKVTVNQILGSGGTATLASATITGAATVGTTLGVTGVSTLASAVVTGDLTVDTSTLKVDSTNNRVGILTASPTHSLDVRGIIKSNGTFTAYINPSFSGAAAIQTESAESLILAPSGQESLRCAPSGVYTFGDGAGSARMTLNSTGLGVGGVPSGVNRFLIFNGATQALTLDTSGRLLVGSTSAFTNLTGSKEVKIGDGGMQTLTVAPLPAATATNIALGGVGGLVYVCGYNGTGQYGAVVLYTAASATVVSVINGTGSTITFGVVSGFLQMTSSLALISVGANCLRF